MKFQVLAVFLHSISGHWLILTLASGQVLALLLSGSGVFSQLLEEKYSIDTPTTQVFFMYFLIALTFTPYLAVVRADFEKVLKSHWWKYLLLALLDVEGNYCFVLAYQYTSLTSIQILGSGGTIIWVMLLSVVFLKVKYQLLHIAGAGVCLLGIAALAYADITSGKSNKGSNPVLGDILCMVGALCYAVTNVSAEFVAKNFSFTHFLGFLGFASSFISAIQLVILDRHHLVEQQWNIPVVLFYVGFALCLYCFYVMSPITMKYSSATLVNLSILTGNVYNLCWGLFLFNYKFTIIYFLSFFMILIGVIMFTILTPKQASPSESIMAKKYWSNYISSLFCEWKCLDAPVSREQEGYHTVQTDLMSDDYSEAEDVLNSSLEENSKNETNSVTEIRAMVT
ncbi:solute carrier family 35 member F2-like [Dysidea avara]|uniref:solute carrier family 35 member F2-like n=1 Tax=Dysidea avara TaxID=196820 RepID=UPI00332EC9EF